jgi:quercetin dioxygenase-like cupin family protein
MKLYNWNQVTEDQLTPTATRQMIHGETMTIARLRFRKGFKVPTHSHANEQITTVEQGSMLFVTPSEKIVVGTGQSLVIPPHVPHSAETLEDCVAVDIFVPVREDWVRGEDAYLRSSGSKPA